MSGGELQRVALTLCLGKPADIYLIEEPSAYLDSEQRIIAAKVIKRFILHAKKTAFVVEHDFIMGTYLADRVVVFKGKSAAHAKAKTPQTLLTGMNLYLKRHFDGILPTSARVLISWIRKRTRNRKQLVIISFLKSK